MDPKQEVTTSQQSCPAASNKTLQKVYIPHYSLLGDVGGTNIRLQLVLVQPPHDKPNQEVKKHTFLVKEHDNFQEVIKLFLSDVPAEKYPTVAVVGIAGPVEDNKVTLSNVPKWGQLNGEQLGNSLKISHFIFLNDFTAVSFGLLLLPEENFVSLNGLPINPKHTRGVMGPGTGLGSSLIYSAPFRKRQRIYVLPSEGGHCDSPWLNDDTADYLKFVGQKIGHSYVGLQYSFCGPAIPYMYQFLARKHNQNLEKTPSSQQIIKTFNSNKQADSLEKKTVQFFIDLYSAAICNFIISRMSTGGIYLVGSLTNALLETLQKTNLTEKFSQRHPEIAKLTNKIPIVVSKEVDLGLKGAFVYARRIISDEQHDQ